MLPAVAHTGGPVRRPQQAVKRRGPARYRVADPLRAGQRIPLAIQCLFQTSRGLAGRGGEGDPNRVPRTRRLQQQGEHLRHSRRLAGARASGNDANRTDGSRESRHPLKVRRSGNPLGKQPLQCGLQDGHGGNRRLQIGHSSRPISGQASAEASRQIPLVAPVTMKIEPARVIQNQRCKGSGPAYDAALCKGFPPSGQIRSSPPFPGGDAGNFSPRPLGQIGADVPLTAVTADRQGREEERRVLPAFQRAHQPGKMPIQREIVRKEELRAHDGSPPFIIRAARRSTAASGGRSR